MKHIIKFTTLLLFLFSFAVFAEENNPEKLPEKLIVALDGQLSPDHAPLIVAKEQGFFKERNLDVTFIVPTNKATASKLVVGGKADVGITYQPDFIKQVDEGKSLVRIGTLIDRPLDCIVTLKSSNINKLADLKGKRIGANNSGLSGLILKTMLKSAGLTEKDITIVPIKNNLTKALTTHQVDAVAGMTRNVDVPNLERQGSQVNVFFPEENGIPNYSVLIFVSRAENMDNDKLSRFLAALKEAVDYLDENPEQTWRSFAKSHPQANNSLNRDMWFATLPYYAEDPADFDQNEWAHFAEFMHNNEMIKMAQPVSKYAINLG